MQSIVNAGKIDTLYSERLAKMEADLSDENYEELVKRVDLNHNNDRFFSRHLTAHFHKEY